MKIRNAIVLSSPEAPKPKGYGKWGKNMQMRKRKGIHYAAELFSQNNYLQFNGDYRRANRILSDDQMWEIYRRCADVRASIDSIVRRVATFDWLVVPRVSPQDPKYDELMKVCNKVNRFLEHPNKNGDTWQEIMTSMLTDCLCFDAGVLEVVTNTNGDLTELVPLRGSSIVPVIDGLGRLLEYCQDPYSDEGYVGNMVTASEARESVITFKPSQIMYLSLFKNTKDPSGNPLLEALVNEVITLMRGSEHAMMALDADEIPPGILVLAGIAGRAAEEAVSDLQMLKGQDHKIRVMTTPDPKGIGANWLELRRTPKDLEFKDIITDIRRAVYRVFGVMPIEMGMTEGMPRATAHAQMDVATSHLVTPMLELLQGRINAQIIPAIIREPELVSQIKFTFDRESKLAPQEQEQLARTHSTYVDSGIYTRNEIREILGLAPIEGGDTPTVQAGGYPVSLQDAIIGSHIDSINNKPNLEENPNKENVIAQENLEE